MPSLRLIRLALATGVLGVTEVPAQRTPRVGLNHFYLIPDSATFAAMSASRFLRDTFGIFEERTTRRSDQTYTGIYWYGQQTYFEFLPPGPGGRRPGDSGLAWGTDAAADSTWVRERYARHTNDSAVVYLITRGIDSVQVPWFTQAMRATGASDQSLVTWAMTYAPDFLARWHSAQPPATASSTRASVLERYSAVVRGHARRAQVPFADVTGLTVALPDSTRTRVIADCEVLALRVIQRRHQCRTADGFTLTLVPQTATRRGVQQVEFVLRRAWPGPARRAFGSSTLLRTGPRRAIWRFGVTS